MHTPVINFHDSKYKYTYNIVYMFLALKKLNIITPLRSNLDAIFYTSMTGQLVPLHTLYIKYLDCTVCNVYIYISILKLVP